MQHLIERNERRTRRIAITLAAALHIALAAALYLQTSQKPDRPTIPVQLEHKHTTPQPKAPAAS
jgi:hypothetical protein